MVTKERKTIVKSISINAYQSERIDKLVDDGKFGSASDVINTAVTEFFT
jgi:Arc/MetJ-type ribon-helix-helix transcriptional regulator